MKIEVDSVVLLGMVENGSTKDEIIFHLMMNEKVPHSSVQKVLNENNIKFKKYGNWERIIDYFRNSDDPTKLGMRKDLMEFGLTFDQSKKYGSSYWMVLNQVYQIGLNKPVPETEVEETEVEEA